MEDGESSGSRVRMAMGGLRIQHSGSRASAAKSGRDDREGEACSHVAIACARAAAAEVHDQAVAAEIRVQAAAACAQKAVAVGVRVLGGLVPLVA